MAYRVLAPNPPQNGGYAIRAPYGLRKFEALLLQRYNQKDVAVVLPNHLEKFVGPDTEIIGIHTMDPLGLGPVSMTFTMGGRMLPFTKAYFEQLVNRSNKVKPHNCKVVVGGMGSWQFEFRPEAINELEIDHVVMGECENVALRIFDQILSGEASEMVKIENTQAPNIQNIPPIVNPSMHGMVEVMRGCPRTCSFCEVALRRYRNIPLDMIKKEVEVNAKSGHTNACLHSDDIFLYQIEDRKTFIPNRDALLELFRMVMNIQGIESASPTHGTISAVAADPLMIEKLSEILRSGPERWIGLQAGLETGSAALMKSHMSRKALPFKGEDWQEVLIESLEILNKNYWFPAFTIMMGLPGETPEDAWATVDLIDKMEALPNANFIIAPLSFVPVGVLRGKEFYEIDEKVDEANFNVAYRCWRHILLEIDTHLWSLARMSFLSKAIVNITGRIGGRYIMRIIERYGRLRGFKIRKPGIAATRSYSVHARPHRLTASAR